MPNEKIDVRILDQGKVWLPYGADKPIRLKSMEPAHVANLLAFLDRRKHTMKLALENYRFNVVASHDGGEMAHDSLTEIAEQLFDQSVDEWFNELPLIVKLRQLKAKYDKKLLPSNFVDAMAKFVDETKSAS